MNDFDKLKLGAGFLFLSHELKRAAEEMDRPEPPGVSVSEDMYHWYSPVYETYDEWGDRIPKPWELPWLKNKPSPPREAQTYLADIPQRFIDDYIFQVYHIQELHDHPEKYERTLPKETIEKAKSIWDMHGVLGYCLNLDKIRANYEASDKQEWEEKVRWNFLKFKKEPIPQEDPIENHPLDFRDRFLKKYKEVCVLDELWKKKYISGPEKMIKQRNEDAWCASPEWEKCRAHLFYSDFSKEAKARKAATREKWIAAHGQPMPKDIRKECEWSDRIWDVSVMDIVYILRTLYALEYEGVLLLQMRYIISIYADLKANNLLIVYSSEVDAMEQELKRQGKTI